MTNRIWMALLCLGLVALTAAIAACGGDDDDTPKSPTPTPSPNADQIALAELTTKLANTDGSSFTSAEQTYYIAHMTDAFLQDFGTPDVAACEADFATCAGDPLPNSTVDPGAIKIDGDKANVTIISDLGPFGIEFARDGDDWKAASTFVPNDEIAKGTEVVDMSLKEFDFNANLTTSTAKSGNFALHVTNDGQQAHEVVLVQLPAEGTIDELLHDDTFQPDPIVLRFPYAPGDSSDVALRAPLTTGRYAFVCFLPDTSEGGDPNNATPHAFKGMVKEFEVE